MSLSSACSYESIWNEKKKLRKGFLILCPLVGAKEKGRVFQGMVPV